MQQQQPQQSRRGISASYSQNSSVATDSSTMNIDDDIPSPPTDQVPPPSTAASSPTVVRCHVPEPRWNSIGFGVQFEPNMVQQQVSRSQITAIGNSRDIAPQPMQRIGGHACPDVALLDSEIAAGDICDRRLSASWQSDYYDAEEYDKENQCVYRENIDNADNILGLANTDNEMGLFLSPAFSEDSMHPNTTNNPAPFGIQSH